MARKNRNCTCVLVEPQELLEVHGIRVNLTLINSGGQLTDNEINGAQRMLQAQHPTLGGMQDTLLGLTRSLLSCAVVVASRHERLDVCVQAG